MAAEVAHFLELNYFQPVDQRQSFKRVGPFRLRSEPTAYPA